MANLILFIVTSIRHDVSDLLGFTPALFFERPWTIITAMFIHAPFPLIGHILGNMVTLYFFGSYLIQLVGERNFWIVYLCGGILGNILFMLMANPLSTAIGASGAIFAVGGALTVMRPKLKVFIIPIPIPIPLWVAVIGGFLILSSPGIAWQAHLGGLVFGLVIASFFRLNERRHLF